MIEVGDVVIINDRHDMSGSPSTWLVEGHLKQIEFTDIIADIVSSGDEIDEMITEIIMDEYKNEIKERSLAGLPCNKKYKLVWCSPDEATHISCRGVCGAIPKISECTKVGTCDFPDSMGDRKSQAIDSIERRNNGFSIFVWE